MSIDFQATNHISIPQIKAFLREMPPTSLIFKAVRNYQSRQTREHLKSSGLLLLQRLFEESGGANVGLFAAFGTLLGIIREGGIISHDCDLDTAYIYKEQSDWDAIDQIFIKAGFHFLKEFTYDGVITERTYSLKGVNIDVFAFIPVDDDTFRAYLYFRDKNHRYKNHEFSVAYVDFPNPGALVKFNAQNNITLTVPAEYKSLLLVTYGENWSVPDAGYNHFDYWKTIDGASGTSTIL